MTARTKASKKATATNKPALPVAGNDDGLRAELERLKKENSDLKAKPAVNAEPFAMKVSDKKAVSVYHGSRFPTTLYAGQWENVLAHAEDILAFIKQNEKVLATKPDRTETTVEKLTG